jgi:hypothetical protein
VGNIPIRFRALKVVICSGEYFLLTANALKRYLADHVDGKCPELEDYGIPLDESSIVDVTGMSKAECAELRWRITLLG